MRIATYNIRVTKVGDILRGRAFLFRLPRILRNLKKVNADVIAFQEVQRLHITCLRLFLPNYKFKWVKFIGDNKGKGGTAIAAKRIYKNAMLDSIKVPSGRNFTSLVLYFDNEPYVFTSIHLSLNNDKLKDVEVINDFADYYASLIVGDFNILANATNHKVFKYLREQGYKKLNHNKGGYHGYGDKDKTPTTVDNFFANFGELEDLQVVEDFKASDHNLMYIDLKL